MNRKFRVISLLAEAASLELDEATEKDSKFEAEFRREFSEVTSFLLEREINNRKRRDESRKAGEAAESFFTPSQKQEIPGKAAKDIYRKLARVTHPDAVGEKFAKDFMEIQNAYNEGDLIGLLKASNKYNISVDLSESEFEDLQKIIDTQRNKIEEIKKTVRWAWCVSDKSREAREQILMSLGTSSKEIQIWRSNKAEKLKKEKAIKEQKRRKAERAARRKATATPYRNRARQKDIEKRKRNRS